MALSASRTETSGLRDFLNSSRGKTLSVASVAIALVLAGFLIWRQLGPTDAEKLSRERLFIDAKTMKAFNYEVKIGDSLPVKAPSGDRTGYPAELCYWTKDGKPRKDPYPVLLNEFVGKSGPTFCPDCGRLVVGHN